MQSAQLKKILIISYFYPPCTLTAAQRPATWVKELHKYGFYPIVITRKWENPIKVYADEGYPTTKGIDVEKNDDFTIYRLPYKSNIRDRFFLKFGSEKFQFLRRTISFFTFLGMNLNFKFSPYRNLLKQAKTIVISDNPCALIISGNPFNQFFMGYHLNKKFSLPWIADYRDDWNTSELKVFTKMLDKLFYLIQTKNEKKWVKSAAYISSVSKYNVNKISKFTHTKGFVLQNGFQSDLKLLSTNYSYDGIFRIIYNGTLYNTQPIELFLEAAINFINNNKSKTAIEIHFPGLAIDFEQEKRVKRNTKGFEKYFFITDRLPRKDILDLQQKANLVLMVAHTNLKGIPSSKIYEYIGLRKKTLLAPGDNEILNEIVDRCKIGYSANNVQSIEKILHQEMMVYESTKMIIPAGLGEVIEEYSGEHQVKILAQHLSKIILK